MTHVVVPVLPLDARTPDELDTVAGVARLLHPDQVRVAAADGLTAEALVAWEEGGAQRATALLERAVACADRTARGARPIFPRLALAGMLSGLGRLAEADRLLDACQPLLADEPDGRWIATPTIFRSRVQLAAGRLTDAVASARAGIELAAQGGACGFVPIAWLTLAVAALDANDVTGAAAATARYRDAPPPPRAGVGWATYAWVHGRIVDARDGADAAFDTLLVIYDDLDAHQQLLLEVPAAAGGLVRLALREGDRTRAGAVATCAARLARANPDVGSLAAAVAHARGILVGDVGLLEKAITGHPHPWARASAAEDAGMVLLDHRAGRGARPFLDRALEEYERAGAVRDAARVRARLRDIGIRRQHGRRQQRPIEGWDSLTDAERRVAELVAEGLTNQQTGGRLFVSHHTVDFHLRQIFRKLGITSRVELAGVARGRFADPRDRGMWGPRRGATLPT
jgi:DNA-binding CsgD family transcriptional regulator